jgi:hypothetical protein
MATRNIGRSELGGMVKAQTLIAELLTIPETTKTHTDTLIRHALASGQVEDLKALDQGHARYFTQEDADKLREIVTADAGSRTDEDRERARRASESLKTARSKVSHHKKKPATAPAKEPPARTSSEPREDDSLTAERILSEPGPTSTRKHPTARKHVDEDDEPAKKGKGSKKWLLIAAGGLALVGALFFVWKARSKKAAAPVAAPQPVTPSSTAVPQTLDDEALSAAYKARMGLL